MNRAFRRFKELADKKKNVYDEDIEAIVGEEVLRVPGQPDRYELLYLLRQFKFRRHTLGDNQVAGARPGENGLRHRRRRRRRLL